MPPTEALHARRDPGIVRQPCRTRAAGGVAAFSATMRTASGTNDGLRSRPGAAFSPARRRAMKRRHQSLTVSRKTPSRTDLSLRHVIGAPQDDLSSLAVGHHDGLCPHSPLQPLHFGPNLHVKDSEPAANLSTLTLFGPELDTFLTSVCFTSKWGSATEMGNASSGSDVVVRFVARGPGERRVFSTIDQYFRQCCAK